MRATAEQWHEDSYRLVPTLCVGMRDSDALRPLINKLKLRTQSILALRATAEQWHEDSYRLVPTLCVGMRVRTLCVR